MVSPPGRPPGNAPVAERTGAGYVARETPANLKIQNPMKPAKSVMLACSLALLALPRAFANDLDSSAADAKFKAMDTDGDGRISRTEHSAGARKMFDAMDANHDGIVTAAEMDACKDQKAERPAPASDTANASVAEKSSAEKIKAIDLDGDGQLTAAEHAAGSEAMFSKMDTDGDGYLSAKELAEGHAMLKKDK
ncbi:MAG: hypothetical protein JWQ83_728 [Lacunisphaera sp.]|nr:hypothetical protein [Lacunisphaera sp.]